MYTIVAGKCTVHFLTMALARMTDSLLEVCRTASLFICLTILLMSLPMWICRSIQQRDLRRIRGY